MMHEFVTYADGTLVVSSDIRKKENGDEYIIISFERPMEYGFDTIVFELPGYEIIEREGHFSEEEIALFKTVVERGAGYFFDVARGGEIQSA